MAGTKRSCCKRFCCFSSSASDEEGQDHPASAGPGSSPSAIDNTTEALPGAPKRTEAPIPGSSNVVTPRREMAGTKRSCCNGFCCFSSSASDVSSSASDVSSSASDEGQDHPPSAETLPGPPERSEAPIPGSSNVETPRKDEIEQHVDTNLESRNILRKSEGEDVNAHPNVSGATQCDEPSSSGSSNLPVKSEGEHVDVNPNVSEAETLPGPPKRSEAPIPGSSNVVTPMEYEIEQHVDPNLDVSGTHQCDKAPLSEPQNILRKSEGENVNAHPNVSGATQCDEPSSSGSSNLPVKSEGEHVDANPNVSEAPSSSSSTGATKSDVIRSIKNIGQADGEKMDVNLDALVDYISKLLKSREEEMLSNKEALNHGNFHWPEGFKKLKAILSCGTDSKNIMELVSKGVDFASKLKDVISGPVTTILKGIGQASVVTAGLLVVAYTLERVQDLSHNKDECWVLIKEMNQLASVVQRLNELNESPETLNVIEEATTLVVEGAITCCTQLGHSWWKSFLKADQDKAVLSGITQRLQLMYPKISANIDIRNSTRIERGLAASERVLAAMESNRNPPVSRIYPDHAVGIDESIEEVVRRLEIESAQKAVTVILHGFGGMGKTTLADAVVSKDTVVSKLVGFKYSMVRMREDSKDSDIVNLQKEILMELGGTISEIKTHEAGQRELLERLKQVQAFIYIDNVWDRDALRKLLPMDMTEAKKVRLLLTARNQDVKDACPRPCTEPEIYQMQQIQRQAAKVILEREIKDGINEHQFNDIIDTCGGIPLMLTLAAPFIGRAHNKQKAYSTLVLQKNKWPSEDFGAMHCAFAYDALPHDCKEPFLDICSYFKGWDWEAVEHIVGKKKLKMLESRALVTRTTNNVASVHDVILTVARQKSKDSEGKEVRLAFTSASKLTEFLEAKGAEGIQGIWLSDNKDALQISAARLDLMSKSLRVLRLGDLANVEGECRETFKELVFFEAKALQLPFHDLSKFTKLRYLSYQPKHELKLSKMPSSLRHMEFDGTSLSHSFQIYSNDLQQLQHLRILRLLNFSRLKNLPENLGDQVKGLNELSLSRCKSITKLPDSISKLQSLRILKMDGCESLTELPVDFGSLSSLRELHLDGCWNLEALPDSAEKLSSLTLLNLSDCSELLNLPPCVGNLTRLVELNLYNCHKLESIPEGIGELKLLRILVVSWCSTLTELPDGLCNLSSITHLSFKRCEKLEKLPDRFGQLASLKVLSLRFCHSLQKLPESFGQLKNLEVLDLGGCDELRELCNDFHCLSSLKNLVLGYCRHLEKLPEDFPCLSSLQRLDLSYCQYLEGKSMDHVVKMNRLQVVRIEGSKQLVDRWAEIQRDGGGSWSFTVITGQDLSISRVEKEKIEKSLLLELDGLLTNKRGEQFHLSHPPPNTLILVTWQLGSIIEEMIDEMQIRVIYIGPDFDQFSTQVKDNIFVVDVPTTRAIQMLEKVHLTLDLTLDLTSDLTSDLRDEYLQIDTRMQVGDEYRSCWRFLTYDEMEEFVVSNCKRYLRLKQLQEERDEESSNIELLTVLFAAQGDETTPVFQKNESSVQQDPTANSEVKATCGVDKLEGKTILLEMRPPESLFYDIRLPSLKEMYLLEKERLNFEIISIPLLYPAEVSSDVFYVYKQFSREVPWLVLQNPWTTLTREVQYFLNKHCTEGEEGDAWEKWCPTINWIIDPNGRITIYRPPISPGDMRERGEVFKLFFNYLESESYQVRWGVNTPLTTLGKIEAVKKNEWEQLKNMSTLEFLFNHLESVSVQVKSLMRQGKFICIFGGSMDRSSLDMTWFMRSAMEQFRDSIHFIQFIHQLRWFPLKNTSREYYHPLENTSEMEGTSLLNLSRHETVRFIMRLRHLEEEMNGMDQSDEQLCELKTILRSFLFKRTTAYLDNRSFTFFDKVGKMVGAFEGAAISSIFSDRYRRDKVQRLINSMLKEGGKEMHDEDSSLIRKMQTAFASAVEQQNTDVYFDALRDYISELWGVQLYQLFELNKEGKKRSPPRVTWPTSRGLRRLKNLLSEGESEDWVKDVISLHYQGYFGEDALIAVVKSLVKDIGEAEWAVAGLLAVADLLERLETVPSLENDRCSQIGWLFVLEEMFRLAQYCKKFNQNAELWRRMKCGAIVVIVRYSIICCRPIDELKYAFSGWLDPREMDLWLWSAEDDLREECDTLAQTMTEDLVDESGSLAHLECYKWGFDLSPDGEGGPSSEYKRSASFPHLWLKNEVEGGPCPPSEYKRSASFPHLWLKNEVEGGPSSEYKRSASFPDMAQNDRRS